MGRKHSNLLTRNDHQLNKNVMSAKKSDISVLIPRPAKECHEIVSRNRSGKTSASKKNVKAVHHIRLLAKILWTQCLEGVR